MFRAEIRWVAHGPTLKMEGQLAGHWAEQAMDLVTKDILPKGLIVDLTDVSYLDSTGEHFLRWLASVGALFVAHSTYSIAACERLSLSPVQRRTEPNKRCYGNNDLRSSIGCLSESSTCQVEEKEESHVLVSSHEKRSRCS
jgi:hypothetical protein